MPEWGISIYYWPVRSLAEDRAIKRGYQDGAQKQEGDAPLFRVDTVAGHVIELIARARDQHGRNLFVESEFDDIVSKYAPSVVERIVSKMEDEYPEEAAKK